MSQLHAMIKGKGKYTGGMQAVVKQPPHTRKKQRNLFTQGKTGFVPHPYSDSVDIQMAKRGMAWTTMNLKHYL